MSMKVFDLQCPQGHVFEGWFRGEDGYEDQRNKGLLNCPVCGSDDIQRKLSAARLNISSRSTPAPTVSSQAEKDQNTTANTTQVARLNELQSRWLAHMRQVIRNTEDVGERFTKEALDMHKGRVEERPIRGTATEEERKELAEEGVEVQLLPDFLDDGTHH